MKAQALTYQFTSRLCGSVFIALSVVLFVVPGVVCVLFGLDCGAASDVVARRTAVLSAGLSYLLIATAKHPPSPTLQKITEAIGFLLLGLAMIGIVEWSRGSVGSGVWLAVGAEVSLAGLLAMTRRSPGVVRQRQ